MLAGFGWVGVPGGSSEEPDLGELTLLALTSDLSKLVLLVNRCHGEYKIKM